MTDARDHFERWYVGALVTQGAREIERNPQGDYILMATRLAWQAFHAGWLEHADGDAPRSMTTSERSGTARKTRSRRCGQKCKCGGTMRPGKALAQTVDCSDEGTCSPAGPGKLIDCMKCERCGWSVTGG